MGVRRDIGEKGPAGGIGFDKVTDAAHDHVASEDPVAFVASEKVSVSIPQSSTSTGLAWMEATLLLFQSGGQHADIACDMGRRRWCDSPRALASTCFRDRRTARERMATPPDQRVPPPVIAHWAAWAAWEPAGGSPRPS